MPTFEEVKAKASRPTQVVTLVLDGEALGDVQELERRLAEAPLPTSLAEQSPQSKYREQIEAAQQRAEESKVPFRLRALSGAEWMSFTAVSQPQKQPDETDDAFQGRWFAFVCEMVARTSVDPVMTPEQVHELVDHLPASSWDALAEAAWELNTRKVTVPFSAAASALTQG